MGKEIKKKVTSYIKEVIKHLRVNDRYELIDKAVIENLKDSYLLILMAQEAIEEHGILIRNSQGELTQNKAIKVKTDAVIRFEKCLEILGIQGKQRYKDRVKEEKEEETPLDKLMKGEL